MFTRQKGPACRQAGQSLIEVLIALTVTVVMIVALIAFVLSGLKNAQFAQKQSKATKLAVETMEQIKTIRDRNGAIYFSYKDVTVPKTATIFPELWQISMSGQDSCISSKCYFNIQSNTLIEGSGASAINIGDGFTRQIIFEDNSPLVYSKEKRVTVNIFWTDSSGDHNSNIQTILSPAI
ncbi:MAG: hypothetical protein Q7R97_02760 [Candidatus Daviesbacteria bacterium]|nr:hypothetical protein [Candidatus Daviesbacteria bacterium]